MFEGLLYRALDPRYADDPLSGEGARRFGGRFNPKGTATLYTSLSPHTAIREANQVGQLRPTILVAYEARIERVFDATSAQVRDPVSAPDRDRADLVADAALISSSTWRDEMMAAGIAGTQAFALRVRDEGFDAVLVPSFAPGSAPGDHNLVLLRWGDEAPGSLRVIEGKRWLL